MAHEYITYTTSELKELFASVGVPGVIISIDTESEPKTCDVETDKWGLIEDVPFFYHCEDNTTTLGYEAFETESDDPDASHVMLLVKNGLNNDKKPNPAYDEIKVVGFYDGKLRKCDHWEDWDKGICGNHEWGSYDTYYYIGLGAAQRYEGVCLPECENNWVYKFEKNSAIVFDYPAVTNRYLEFYVASYRTDGIDMNLPASQCLVKMPIREYIGESFQSYAYMRLKLNINGVSKGHVFFLIYGDATYHEWSNLDGKWSGSWNAYLHFVTFDDNDIATLNFPTNTFVKAVAIAGSVYNGYTYVNDHIKMAIDWIDFKLKDI